MNRVGWVIIFRSLKELSKHDTSTWLKSPVMKTSWLGYSERSWSIVAETSSQRALDAFLLRDAPWGRYNVTKIHANVLWETRRTRSSTSANCETDNSNEEIIQKEIISYQVRLSNTDDIWRKFWNEKWKFIQLIHYGTSIKEAEIRKTVSSLSWAKFRVPLNNFSTAKIIFLLRFFISSSKIHPEGVFCLRVVRLLT